MLHGGGAFSSICESGDDLLKSRPLIKYYRPTGGIAAVVLFFFLNLNPHQGRTFREHVADFDFVGLILIVGGLICLLLGFNESENGCTFSLPNLLFPFSMFHAIGNRPVVIAEIAVGGVLLVAGGINECYTTRSPIVPPRLFKVREPLLAAFPERCEVTVYADSNHKHSPDHNPPPRPCILLWSVLSPALLSNPRRICYEGWCRDDPLLSGMLYNICYFWDLCQSDRQVQRNAVGRVWYLRHRHGLNDHAG